MSDTSQSTGESLTQLLSSIITGTADNITKAYSIFITASTTIRAIASTVADSAGMAELNLIRSQYPYVPLSPAVLADMVVRNIMTQGEAEIFASLSGLSNTNFSLVQLNAP